MLKPKPPVVEGPEASSQIQALNVAVRDGRGNNLIEHSSIKFRHLVDL